MDFSLRRAHGVDAGMKAARSSYMVGFSSTSNVLAGKAYGLPIAGTMAHSFVTSFEREIDAFRAYAESFPDDTVLLLDTYNTVAAAAKAAEVGREMEARGHRLRAVRLDSGDLLWVEHVDVRRVLDEAGLDYVRVLVSGGLDEFQVDELVQAGAPIDAFGVGTRMAVSGDAPSVARYGLQAGEVRRSPAIPFSSSAQARSLWRTRSRSSASGTTKAGLEAMLSVCQTRRRPNPALSLCWRPSWRTAKCWHLRLRLRS